MPFKVYEYMNNASLFFNLKVSTYINILSIVEEQNLIKENDCLSQRSYLVLKWVGKTLNLC